MSVLGRFLVTTRSNADTLFRCSLSASLPLAVCKARRIRCDGVQPCFQCQKRGRSVCVFHGPKRAPKKKAASVEHLEQRIHQLESMLRHQSDSKSDGTTDGSPRFSAANEGASRPWEATANFAGGSNGIFSRKLPLGLILQARTFPNSGLLLYYQLNSVSCRHRTLHMRRPTFRRLRMAATPSLTPRWDRGSRPTGFTPDARAPPSSATMPLLKVF